MSETTTAKRRFPLALVVFAVMAIAAVSAIAFGRRAAHGPLPAVTKGRLVDVRGRAIELAGPVHKLAIDDGRYLVALGLIHPDPTSLLVAWAHDVNRLGTETYEQLLKKLPGLAKLPRIASSAGSLDVELLLAAAPDVALLSLESAITEEQTKRIEAAGIKVVIVDFFVKPFENLEPSLRLLGGLTGREAQAREFIEYRAAHMKRIADGVAALPPTDRPLVFFEAHAGMSPECCNSPGRGNVGDYLGFVGGHNIGADAITQSFGKLNLEYVISRDPAVYIASGGPHLEKAGGLVLGARYDRERARGSLAKVADRRGIAGLTAVKAGRVHGFSHLLINSPLDILAIEAFARWVHPEKFGDVDPAATLAEINRRFLAVPYEGVYWVDLR